MHQDCLPCNVECTPCYRWPSDIRSFAFEIEAQAVGCCFSICFHFTIMLSDTFILARARARACACASAEHAQWEVQPRARWHEACVCSP
jgi:hypothetical protein